MKEAKKILELESLRSRIHFDTPTGDSKLANIDEQQARLAVALAKKVSEPLDVEELLNRLAVTLGGLGAYRDELNLGQQRESLHDAINALTSQALRLKEKEEEAQRLRQQVIHLSVNALAAQDKEGGEEKAE